MGEAEDGLGAIALVEKLRPDVVIMDIRMPVLDGIAAAARIQSLAHAPRVLILTTFEDEEYVDQALRAGAAGFIGKGSDPAEIAKAVRTVHQGEAPLSAKAARVIIDGYLTNSAESARVNQPSLLIGLTTREREVLRLVALGHNNDAIANSLSISAATVKTHINRMMPKLDAHDRAQLVVVAYRAGLVSPGDPG